MRVQRHTFAFALLAVFAFVWSMSCGERGFFPLHQSIVFDGGWRVLSGQVPFKDFVAPIGPVTFWWQALVFLLLGVNYWAYLVAAAVANVAAVFLTVGLVRLLFPGEHKVAWAAGMLTAVWFYPQYGTPFPDQTAFLLALTAWFLITTVMRGVWQRRLAAVLALLAAGAATTLSFLSRQDAGLFALPVSYLLLVLRPYARRGPPAAADLLSRTLRVATFSAGWALSIGVFLWWLRTWGDPALFQRFFLDIPAAAGIERILERWPEFFLSWGPGAGPLPVKIGLGLATLVVFLVSLLLAFAALTRTRLAGDAWLGCTLCIGCLLYQCAYLTTSNHHDVAGMPFLGLVFVVGFRSLWFVFVIGRSRRQLLRALTVLLGLWMLVTGMRTSWARTGYQIFEHATFDGQVQVAGLEALRWAEPTGDYKREDIEELADFLQRSSKSFFVFPDFTVLYGVIGRPSPQPLLWFQRGLTFPASYDATVDEWVVSSLQRNAVEVVVVERASFYGWWYDRLVDFPLLASYLANEFQAPWSIGPFYVLEHR